MKFHNLVYLFCNCLEKELLADYKVLYKHQAGSENITTFLGGPFSWVWLLTGDGAAGSGVFATTGLGDFLHWLLWLGGRGLVFPSCGLGVRTSSGWGVGVLALSAVSSFLGLGVRAGGSVSFCMLVDIAFVFMVFVLRGGFFISHVPTNSPQGLFEERGIPGKMCPWSLLIGWVKPSRVDGRSLNLLVISQFCNLRAANSFSYWFALKCVDIFAVWWDELHQSTR